MLNFTYIIRDSKQNQNTYRNITQIFRDIKKYSEI